MASSQASPKAIRLAPDGHLYIGSGATAINTIPGLLRNGVVYTVDPTQENPQPISSCVGFAMPNDMAFDHTGALYVADSGIGVIRVDEQRVIDEE